MQRRLIIIPAGASGIDFAYWRPGAAVKPWAFVVRYLSTNRANGKNVTAAEVAFYHSIGVAVLLVWEQGASDWQQGAALGATHGAAAVAFAQSLDYPRGAVILCAFDSNAVPGDPRALAYGTAFADACIAGGYDFGPYADLDVIRVLADRSGLNWLAGATSWSDPTKPYQPETMPGYGLVHVRQVISGSTPNYDNNVVLRSFPAWLPHDTPTIITPGDDMSVIITCSDDASLNPFLLDAGYATGVDPSSLNTGFPTLPVSAGAWHELVAISNAKKAADAAMAKGITVTGGGGLPTGFSGSITLTPSV